MNEKQMSDLNKAKIAGMLIDNLSSYVENRKKIYLEMLKSDFRSGKHDLNKYISMISAFCSLDDLMSDLTKDVKFGKSIQGGMNEFNGEPKPR